MTLIGYHYGIRSERRLEQEIKVNVAYHWFLGLGLTDPVPDHSTISQNRRRRFNGSNIFEEIFDEIVRQAMGSGLAGRKYLFSDSTHLKASANRIRSEVVEIEQTSGDYISDLEAAVKDDRQDHGKKPLKPRRRRDEPQNKRRVKRSLTDRDSGYMYRDRRSEGFYYLDHVTTDGIHNIITDIYVTPGNVHDSVPYLERLDHQMDKLNLDVEAVRLDADYNTAPICMGLHDRGIFGVIPHVRTRRKGCRMMPDDRHRHEHQEAGSPSSLFYQLLAANPA